MKEERIYIRVTTQEKITIEKQAAKQKRTVSNYIMWLIASDGMKKEK